MAVPKPAAGQSLEEMHRLIGAAIVQRRAVAALYDGARRLLCPHVLGYGQPGEWRVFCYQYGGESKSGLSPVGGPGAWRCLSLKKLSSVELLDGAWRSAPHARQRCVQNVEIDAEDYPPGGDPQNGQ